MKQQEKTEGLSTGFDAKDGAYIYCGEGSEAPYMLVCRQKGRNMTPEKYFKACDNGLILAIHVTEDDYGEAIYNRQDFIDRAAASPDFTAMLLGADTVHFTEGSEEKFNGKSFYCYPMTLESGGFGYAGELCLANADETGCWLVCYAVRDGCPEHDKTLELMRECAKSIKVD